MFERVNPADVMSCVLLEDVVSAVDGVEIYAGETVLCSRSALASGAAALYVWPLRERLFPLNKVWVGAEMLDLDWTKIG